MKKLLALLPAAALWASGCGDSCTNKSAEARASSTATCAVKDTSPVTVTVTPACASCAEDAPKCDISYLGVGQQQLNIQVRECDSNKGCSSASCSFGSVTCTFTPTASGPVDVVYQVGGSTGTLTITIGTGTSNSCTIPTA